MLIWVAGIALLLLISLICILLYCYRTCFYSPRNRREDPYTLLQGEQYSALSEGIFFCTRKMEEAPCEFVSVQSCDGLSLGGRYYHNYDSAPLLILFHGYRSMTLRDSTGGFLLGKKAGFNVLAVDQRAHGRSEGTVITFGVKERYDCLSWIQFANQRFGKHIPIVISGLSMGAATVLMAASLDLPENVVGIMADCPYSSPAEIIRKVARDMKIPDAPVYPLIKLSAKLFGKFDLEGCSAESSVRHAKIPILLLHGEDDRFVPCDMSRKIATACASHCELHTFPDAGHGLCYTMDADRYESAVVHFMNNIPQLKDHISNNAFSREILERTL